MGHEVGQEGTIRPGATRLPRHDDADVTTRSQARGSDDGRVGEEMSGSHGEAAQQGSFEVSLVRALDRGKLDMARTT